MRPMFVPVLLVFAIPVQAQKFAQWEVIGIARNKTVSLVFPYAIQTIDRGSDAVLVQKATDNILKVKAGIDSFPESSLTVITTDGKLYSLIVSFREHPLQLQYYFGDSSSTHVDHPLDRKCRELLRMRSNGPTVKYSSGNVSVDLLGWFVSGNALYCKLKFANRSAIGYDADQFHLYMRDNVVAKRTASQEIEQYPLYIYGDTGTLKAHSTRLWIVVLEKFTIPDDRHFAMELLEKNGGRHLYLRSYQRQLMRAREF